MVCQATGVPEKFAGVPAGARAIQLWDSKVPHDFLRLFGRPVRVTTCECERNAEPGVGQVLHLLNSPELHAKLTHEAGTVARLVRRLPDDADAGRRALPDVLQPVPRPTRSAGWPWPTSARDPARRRRGGRGPGLEPDEYPGIPLQPLTTNRGRAAVANRDQFCDGVGRRDFLRLGTAGLFGMGLTLPGLLRAQALAGRRRAGRPATSR